MIKNERGFALIMAIILSLSIAIIGGIAMYVSELGFMSVKAEYGYHIAEKNANLGIMNAIQDLRTKSCGFREDYSSNVIQGSSSVVTIERAGYCFIWSKGGAGTSRVVKTAIVNSINPVRDFAAMALRVVPATFNLGGSSSIESCQEYNGQPCPIPALMTGGDDRITPPPEPSTKGCNSNPNSRKMLSAWDNVDPYDTFPQDINLMEWIFNNSCLRSETNPEDTLTRDDLVSVFQRIDTDNTCKSGCTFGVKLGDNGEPLGFNGDDGSDDKIISDSSSFDDKKYDTCKFTNVSSASVDSGNELSIKINTVTVKFSWDSTGRRWEKQNDPKTYCSRIDLGNTELLVNKAINLVSSDGNINTNPLQGSIAAGKITIKDNISGITFVARESIDFDNNNLTIERTNIFSKNFNFGKSSNNLTYRSGILYAGSGSIQVVANTRLGTSDAPILLVADGPFAFTIDSKGGAEINGLVFITSNAINNTTSPSVSISGAGNFSLNGALISDSPDRDNKVDISGNLSVRLNFDTLENLSNTFNCLNRNFKETYCNEFPSRRQSLITTKTIVY